MKASEVGAKDRSSAGRRRATHDPVEIEARWQARWKADPLFSFDVERVDQEEKFYNLVEFPYPSAEGLHVGHAYTYCGADAIGRHLRMRGRKVFQPMGFDSFGIHTENYALRVGEHPRTLTVRTVEGYREQLRRLGAAWDWPYEVVTSDPSYYRWTQWIFVQLHRAGLAVRKEAPVVWCPSCLTVLAFEQLEGDRCERCGSAVTERVMRQWFLRITAYAERLLEGLTTLDWPETAKRLQAEWIGRSRGLEVDFQVKGMPGVRLPAFTTRPDTVFGVTFVAIAPRHPLAAELAAKGNEDVRSLIDRTAVRPGTGHDPPDGPEGVFSGLYAIGPADASEVPIFVAPYVVAGYGGGVVMGVPAHDERDRAFAVAHGLPVVTVIEGAEPDAPRAWTGEGSLVASGPFTGMPSSEAREAVADWLEGRGVGRRATRYRLHDWLISRQRYWGPPIPIVYCERCGEVPVPEDDLPVILPDVSDFRPAGTGRSPLALVDSFVNTTCPACGGAGRRETDVSDTFLDSAWYFLRYPSARVDEVPWEPERTARLLPVDLYAGGKEHVVRHHLYARFLTMALHDLGHLPFPEPFPRLLLHGLLIKDGAKMSKSRGNVVNPDDYVATVGADALRMYLLFCGPWEEGGDFSDQGLAGIQRFARRAWRVVTAEHVPGTGDVDMAPLDRAVARVEEGIDRLKFNTAISASMDLTRWAMAERGRMSADQWRRAASTLVLLLAPFAPHLAEELWSELGGEYSVHRQPWPDVDRRVLQDREVVLVVQVNGKVRDRLTVPAGTGQDRATAMALERENVRRHLHGDPRTVVFVPDRLINLVA